MTALRRTMNAKFLAPAFETLDELGDLRARCAAFNGDGVPWPIVERLVSLVERLWDEMASTRALIRENAPSEGFADPDEYTLAALLFPLGQLRQAPGRQLEIRLNVHPAWSDTCQSAIRRLEHELHAGEPIFDAAGRRHVLGTSAATHSALRAVCLAIDSASQGRVLVDPLTDSDREDLRRVIHDQ